MHNEPGNLVESLERAARNGPDRGIGIFDGRGRGLDRRTYPELLRSVLAAASRYCSLGVEPGDRVLVGLPTGWDWMEAWLGALALGALPAALAPAGGLGSNEAYLERLQALHRRVGARRVVVPPRVGEEIGQRGLERLAASVLLPEQLLGAPADPGFEPHRARPEDVAFLQFTSGSTGLPRAVMIPHAAVVHNNLASDEAIGAPYGSRAGAWADGMVSWLPMHHDMGLVGCLFLSIHLAQDLWLLQPTTFLARPHLWLEKLSERGTTFAPAPNFGYQLCSERLKPDDLEGHDLSGWRSAMTGAEMVRPGTCGSFADLTAVAGFRREALCPCFGLAEATLAVTFDLRGEGLRTRPVPEDAAEGLGLSEVACVGTPVRDTAVRICTPDGSALPDGEVGEVRVAGPGIFVGYWDDAEATAEGLRDGWLCTGDLGFLHDGELYLSGRLKDVLIVRGNNVMPHELEWHAEAVAAGGGSLRSGAFAVARDEQGEQAVVVMETTESDRVRLRRMETEIRNRIGRALSLPLADLVFVRRGRIPKTTSGKVRRKQLKHMYLAAELDRIETGGVANDG